MREQFFTEAHRIGRRVENAREKIRYDDADIGRHFGFDRIAVHHISLPPESRTSLPHAESTEEEFVFVVKGTPSLWLNGELYPMEPGDFVGFPSSTGIGHAILNNSSASCELIVAGERTKRDNQCVFLLEPDIADEMGSFWWSDAPVQALGSESGWPKLGATGTQALSSRPSYFGQYLFVKEHLPFSYKTCKRKETFSLGRDITEAAGLNKLGIYVDRLPPGKRSSWPHAHKIEDELVFVLEGHVKVWINGHYHLATAGDFVGFKSSAGDVHTILNEGDQDAYLFVLGERDHPAGEKIYYSHHPEQNALNQSQHNSFWADWPRKELGPDDPTPADYR